ncbi:methyltransferase domain-containing protein [Demequina sp. SO4-18]|uniref:methyltransferase domain-containing protein n=1 Tax=Demequina sp. SO4-18 TaxID=3401026 RepID=UPI003B5A79C7
MRAARVIHTCGQPGKYYGITNIYLEDRDAGVKWWTMDSDVSDTALINRATNTRLYGVQTAPTTASGIETRYDSIATSFDVSNATSETLANRLRRAVRDHTGPYPPHVLDLACGTGRVLDLELAMPERYAGVDASAPMLNQLVRKHPSVARLYPMRVEEALANGHFTERQFDVVTLIVGDDDAFSSEVAASARKIANRVFIHAVGNEVETYVR